MGIEIKGIIDEAVGLIKNLIETAKSYLESYLGMPKPYQLWIFTSIGIIILFIIVMWRLRIALKKIRRRKTPKKEKKPRDIKENKEIKKPIIKPQTEKKIIKPNRIIESKYGEDAEIKKSIVKPIIEKKIIKPEAIIERKIIKSDRIIEKIYKNDAEMEKLRRKIINIERKQRIRILEEMRKQVRSNRK
jgi:hypothetical protein